VGDGICRTKLRTFGGCRAEPSPCSAAGRLKLVEELLMVRQSFTGVRKLGTHLILTVCFSSQRMRL